MIDATSALIHLVRYGVLDFNLRLLYDRCVQVHATQSIKSTPCPVVNHPIMGCNTDML
jgi:hypothetical protein